MAKADLLFPKIKKWEGGFSNHSCDKGGGTNMGITLKTWRSMGYDKDDDGDIDLADLLLITEDDVFNLFKSHYWDKCKADLIMSQAVADMLVDWFWNSGSIAIKKIQRLVGVKDDGIIGPITLLAINSLRSDLLVYNLKNSRLDFVFNICERDPSQKVFINGWVDRINDVFYSE